MHVDHRDKIPESNYSKKVITPKGIIYHITADRYKHQALNWVKNPISKVSYNSIFEPDGEISLCVSYNRAAYHAGKVENSTAEIIKDNAYSNPNYYMIGFGVVSDGAGITAEQYESLKLETLEVTQAYNIPLNRYALIGHNETSGVRRKYDPIVSYTPKEIILLCEIEKIKQHNFVLVNRLKTDKEQLDDLLTVEKRLNETMEKEIDRLTRIVKKSRTYSEKIKDFYIKTISDLRKKKWYNCFVSLTLYFYYYVEKRPPSWAVFPL